LFIEASLELDPICVMAAIKVHNKTALQLIKKPPAISATNEQRTAKSSGMWPNHFGSLYCLASMTQR
ncbi:hypothetical protein EA143_25410, partial [Enterobacter hormaechei]